MFETILGKALPLIQAFAPSLATVLCSQDPLSSCMLAIELLENAYDSNLSEIKNDILNDIDAPKTLAALELKFIKFRNNKI